MKGLPLTASIPPKKTNLRYPPKVLAMIICLSYLDSAISTATVFELLEKELMPSSVRHCQAIFGIFFVVCSSSSFRMRSWSSRFKEQARAHVT